jgi:predicted solute-binding protein
MDFGNMDDVSWMRNVYTPDEIIEVVKKSRGLSRKSAYFWSAYFNIPREEIKSLEAILPEKIRLLW